MKKPFEAKISKGSPMNLTFYYSAVLFVVLSMRLEAQNVIQVPLVVHVLYNQPSDSIPPELIQTIILDSVNADFRRQNLNAIYTQTAYLPIAADTEIEFQFAQVDPNGNPTTGIIYKYTETPHFYRQFGRDMMYDSLGGADPWDECRYLNLWVCGLNSTIEYENQWNSASPLGVVVDRGVLTVVTPHKLYHYLTHYFGHFLGLGSFYPSSQCFDSDGIADTPIQSAYVNPQIAYDNPDSIFQETTCSPIPEGQMAGNFMMATNSFFIKYMNMFTLGQKERMHNFIFEHFPGYQNPEVSCFTGIVEEDERTKTGFEVYPNPSTGQVTLTAKASTQNLALKVWDANGREIMSESWSAVNGPKELQLSSGLYYITLSGDSFSESKKVVIQ
jgi:hypothetical protein